MKPTVKIEADGLLRIPYFWETPDTKEALCVDCAVGGWFESEVADLRPRYATETSRLCVRCLVTIGPINEKEARGE